jgi:peptide/nickel transport system ATP-binding protein
MAGSGTAHLRPGQPDIVLTVEGLVVEFGHGAGTVHAVSNISFDVAKGETLGLVGESGCGKSTTGRAIMQLPRPTGGSVKLGERELTTLKGEELRRTRTQLQMIFQDPISSLNPRRKIKDIVGEGISIWEKKDKSSPTIASTRCCPTWGSTRTPSVTAAPTSSRAASASASAWPARWCSTPTSSSATNRSRRSTCRSRRRS